MSLDDVYRAFAGTLGPVTCPARVPAPARTVEPFGHVGHLGHHEKEERQGEAGPAYEVETLLATLADAGRDLGPELSHHLRGRLAPLSRQVRAELVAVIDDAFEVAPDLMAARRQACRLLSNARALEAAKAAWPACPEPPAPTGSEAAMAGHAEPLTPWLAHIDRYCELVPDDRRYLMDHLAGRPRDEAMRMTHGYIEAWAASSDVEPVAHRKANAGRRAANTFLRGATA